MASQPPSGEDQRRNQRTQMDLPIQVRLGEGERLDLELVGINATGTQIRSEDCDVLRSGFDAQHNTATFEIRFVARLSWARPEPEGGFLTGWEFSVKDGEALIG